MLGDEDFGPVAEDNLALIDADEKKIEVENQFMQDDAMVNNSAQWVILPNFVVFCPIHFGPRTKFSITNLSLLLHASD